MIGLVAVFAVLCGLLVHSLYQRADAGEPLAANVPGPVGPRLSPEAALAPRAGEIEALISAHYEAINRRDYQAWKKTVVARRHQETPEPLWREQLASTRDGDVVIHRIDPAPGGSLSVLMTFTSTQDPNLAPRETPYACLRWHVVYSVVRELNLPRLDMGQPHSSYATACP